MSKDPMIAERVKHFKQRQLTLAEKRKKRKHPEQEIRLKDTSIIFSLGGARRFSSLKAMDAYLKHHPELKVT